MNSRWIIQSYEKQSKHIRIICMESTREEACDTLYDSLIPDFSNNCIFNMMIKMNILKEKKKMII